ncbi:hypothetical protein Lser_V15G09212 [Lactuca serriola]
MKMMRLFISAVCTVLSFLGLQFWTELSNVKLNSDGLIMGEHYVHFCVAKCAVENPYITTALVLNFILNVYTLIFISLKTIYFVESWKLVKRLFKYVLFKMFEALARERLEQLNTSSPNYASLWNHLGIYYVLLVVFILDAFWIMMCLDIYQTIPSSMFLLVLFFEPLSIAFETLQGILVHGFQLVDIWAHHSRGNTTNSKLLTFMDTSAAASKTLMYSMSYTTIVPSPLFWLLFFEPLSIVLETLQAILFHGFQLIDIWLHYPPRNTTNSKLLKVLDMAAGLLWEQKRIILRDVGFFLDIMSLFMSLGHYMHIWFLVLDDMTFPLVDAMLTLPIQGVLSAAVMRMREFIISLRMGVDVGVGGGGDGSGSTTVVVMTGDGGGGGNCVSSGGDGGGSGGGGASDGLVVVVVGR